MSMGYRTKPAVHRIATPIVELNSLMDVARLKAFNKHVYVQIFTYR